MGWSFTVSGSDLTVEALGVFDQGADRLVDSHPVGIWDSTGANLLAQVTVPPGTTATLNGGYRFESISPIALLAGVTYVIGAYYPGIASLTAPQDDIILLSTQTYAGITFVQSRQSLLEAAGSFVFPNLDASVSQGAFGPNFEFLEATATPEPSRLAG